MVRTQGRVPPLPVLERQQERAQQVNRASSLLVYCSTCVIVLSKVQQREIQKKILQECSLCNDRSHRWTMLFFDGLRNVKLKPKAKACEAQSLFLFEHQIIA